MQSLDKHRVPCFNDQDAQGQVSARRHCFITPPLLTFVLNTGPPVIHSGIKDLKVLKTTQSGFEGFIKDQFTTLPEVKDRCFATQVYCKWRYQRCRDVDFEATWYEHVLGPGIGTGNVCPCPRGLKFMKSSICKEIWKTIQFNCPTVQNPFYCITESQRSYSELIDLPLTLRCY